MVNLYIMLFILKSNESEMKLSLKVYRLKTHYFAILLTTISKLFFLGGRGVQTSKFENGRIQHTGQSS